MSTDIEHAAFEAWAYERYGTKIEWDADGEPQSEWSPEWNGWQARAAIPQAPTCPHRVADARNPVVTSGYICIDCGAVFAAADHFAPPAPTPAAAEGQAERIIEVLTAERDQARAQYDHVFKVMMSVYGLAPSGQNIQLEDGRVMWFKDPNAAETLHMLGRAIHEIPKKLAEAAQVVEVQAPSAPDDDSMDQFYPPKAALKREDWDPATRKPKVAAPLPRQAAVQGDSADCKWTGGKCDCTRAQAQRCEILNSAPPRATQQDAPQTAPDQAKSAPATTEREA